MRGQLELACLRAALELVPRLPEGSLLSVNVSGPVLLDERTLALLLEQPALDRVIVEITEDALVQDDAGFHAALAPLVARGVRLAVDDMGAGYSGLRQITALRPAYLKLDRSLVRGVDASPDRAALIEALLHYAGRTGGLLVAEGVETRSELDAVRRLGVPLVQGFHYGRPGAPWPVVLPPGLALAEPLVPRAQ
ncbi:EAL domain-containing protein [Baekduia soli]|uniref:EAL domain-containing protein n=1 Tax=Baekduia soli TaxID=496014 RepID=UPI00225E5280|nr:EAL domain-containing protein [Baekduia soli]